MFNVFITKTVKSIKGFPKLLTKHWKPLSAIFTLFIVVALGRSYMEYHSYVHCVHTGMDLLSTIPTGWKYTIELCRELHGI